MKLPIGTYSFYSQLEQCPHKAYHVYVGKTVPFVKTEQMIWGDTVHKAMENRIKHGSPLPDECASAEKVSTYFYDTSRLVPVKVELALAMQQNGQPCDYEDKDNAWFRGKLDCVTMPESRQHAWMVDWKTGNVREDPFELECGALLLKVHYPTLESIVGEYFWMRTGQSGLRYNIRDHANTYNRIWKLRNEAEDYLRNGAWPKRKSPLCNWCPVKDCEHYTGRNVNAGS